MVRCVRETETLFEMSNGLRLSKKGLSEAAQAKIRRGMKSFAHGGRVSDETVEDDIAALTARREAALANVGPGPQAVPDAPPGPPDPLPEVGPLGFSLGTAGIQSGLMGLSPKLPLDRVANMSVTERLAMPLAIPGAILAAATGGLDTPPPVLNPSGTMDTPRDDTLSDAEVMPQSPAVEPSPNSAPATRIATPQFDTVAYDKALAEETAGLQAQAAVAQEQAAAETAIHQRTASLLESGRADFERERAELSQRADAVQSQVISGEIDPNRLWDNLSTGRKVLAVASIILGGVGSRGGPNTALAVIDRAIDRDIEAQRLAIAQKRAEKAQTLSYYMQRGHDLRASYGLAKADMMDLAAAQLAAVSAKVGGARAEATMQVATGALRRQAAALRDQHLQQSFDNRVKAQLAASEIDARRAQAQESRAKVNEVRAAKAWTESGVKVMQHLLAGGAVTSAQKMLLTEKAQERLVPDRADPSKEYLARSEKAAEAVRSARAVAEPAMQLAEKIVEFRKKYGGENPWSANSEEGRLLARYAGLATKADENLGAWDTGTQDLLADIQKDPGAIFTRDATIFAQAQAMYDRAKSKLDAVENVSLNRRPVRGNIAETK